MDFEHPMAMMNTDEDEALHRILEGTSGATGERFFSALVENLTQVLGTYSAWVTEYSAPTRHLRSLAFWVNGRSFPNFSMDIAGTPCEVVIQRGDLVHYPDNILDIFPRNTPLKEFHAVSYMGMPLLGTDQEILGNLAVLDTRPMPRKPRFVTIFRIFAARAAAELRRLRAENALRQREEKYRRIVETAGEGFILTDEHGVITDVNRAFCRMVGAGREAIIGRRPPDLSSIEPHAFFLQKTPPGSIQDYYTFECMVLAASGERIPVLVHGSILRDDLGAVIGKMAFVTDMRQHKKSLALAAEVQRSFIPRPPAGSVGLDVDWKTVSSEAVGGDYLDFFHGGTCGTEDFGIVVGDVMGHGVDAALMMMSARAFLRIHATTCRDIADLITRMNHSFTQDARLTSRFMTLFYLSISPTSRQIRWVRAGHDPALVYVPAQDLFSELKGPGMALGLDENYAYEASLASGIAPGQIIAIGTDGIWEARNSQGAMYGRERFRRVIRASSHLSAGGIIASVFRDLKAFSAGRSRHDDITLAVVKAKGRPGEGLEYQI